ncbi:lysophospholipase L1-like esterase [Thermosporothrix hazakensis]|jgi:lysophospholipase L1-like esterase|uniref:Lysophospholipase L1-like esterase n=1 Tax=Thermosporothrix hazakensis TaxID=644383 RepID=A0A326TT47_THEHA|nr:SGNH/GDSL hydrolase family protein [Thermosporothrix hazakensis]PZW19711.1 lysophospholipase L1-like esterase [Thermosporothrix hazakensis]GCE48581.1 hypothetical protein KTH_34500 [Thermosporothrix hazakensis]
MKWLKYLFLLSLITLVLTGCAGSILQSGSPTQKPSPRENIYVAIGASDTVGVGTEHPETESWPARLVELLDHKTRLVNLGFSGITMHEALASELPPALEVHPRLVTIWLAVNDLAEHVSAISYAHDLETMITSLKQAEPQITIAVANVPDLTLLPRFRTTDRKALMQQISAYNSAIKAITTRQQVILVDLYQRWSEIKQHPEYISADGFHPSAAGYKRLARIFYQTLQEKRVQGRESNDWRWTESATVTSIRKASSVQTAR